MQSAWGHCRGGESIASPPTIPVARDAHDLPDASKPPRRKLRWQFDPQVRIHGAQFHGIALHELFGQTTYSRWVPGFFPGVIRTARLHLAYDTNERSSSSVPPSCLHGEEQPYTCFKIICLSVRLNGGSRISMVLVEESLSAEWVMRILNRTTSSTHNFAFTLFSRSTTQLRYTQSTANLPAPLGWRQDTLWHKLHNAFTDTNHLVPPDSMHRHSIN